MPNPGIPPDTPTAERALEAEGLVAIEGRNFSGRTDLLREFVGLAGWKSPNATYDGRCAYIGPEIYNALSGLALSVEDEVRLHSEKTESTIDDLLEALGLAPLRDRNPFELSGGEQALTALAAALALFPERLSLDCCFEQVDADMRQRVLELLQPLVEQGASVALADNRLKEYAPCFRPRVRTIIERRERDTDWPELATVRAPQDIPATSSASTITLDGIGFSYQRRGAPVLREVSIALEPGRVYLLEGKNGSGKTTLAKILCGALRPQRGVLRADGRPYCPWQEPARLFAYHFQNPDLQLFCSTVRDELVAGPTALNMDSESTEVCAGRWADVFGLSRALDWHPLDLPFVCRKRVALAATLTMARPWLILDEPTLGQDDETSETLSSIINQLTACGLGVLVISHSVDFRRRLSGHRLLLSGGILTEHD